MMESAVFHPSDGSSPFHMEDAVTRYCAKYPGSEEDLCKFEMYRKMIIHYAVCTAITN